MGITDPYINVLKRSFQKIWCASAYKGAAQPNTQCVPLLNRLQNQAFWIEKAILHTDSFEGIILTGWSRFCHQLILCELFPVSVHSLALCLNVIRNGDSELRKIYKFVNSLRLNSKVALRTQQEILNLYGSEELLKSHILDPNRKSIPDKDSEFSLNWCDECLEMSWELEKARVLYKSLRKEAQQYIPLNYDIIQPASSITKQNKSDLLVFRRRSYDSAPNASSPLNFPIMNMPKDRRYNIKHKSGLTKNLQTCLNIVLHEEMRVDFCLGKWLYPDDVADFKNVFFLIGT